MNPDNPRPYTRAALRTIDLAVDAHEISFMEGWEAKEALRSAAKSAERRARRRRERAAAAQNPTGPTGSDA